MLVTWHCSKHPTRPDLRCHECRSQITANDAEPDRKPVTPTLSAAMLAARGPFSMPTVCPHEGPILEFCTTCKNSELRHVRECDVHDKCTRGPNDVGMASCETCPDHPERKVMVRWSYGVTTVPKRRKDLLPRTLNSLKAAGFDKPRLFVDGERDPKSWEDEFGLEVTARWPNVRTHGNWVLSAYELWLRDPHADRFAIFQDDFITMRNLRGYLDKCKLPDNAYWNLYTFPENERVAAEIEKVQKGWFKSNQCGRGAVALVFSRRGLTQVLHHAHMIERVEDDHRGHKAVDGGIVTAMMKSGYVEMCHTPSLVQHTGEVSSMMSAPHPQAPTFRGEDYDALELLK